jgi:hypothetical protein
VKDAIKDMPSRMVYVLPLIYLTQTIKVAEPGKMEYAHNALLDGISVQIMSVIQSMIYAEHGLMLLVLANHVIMDILYKVENV